MSPAGEQGDADGKAFKETGEFLGVLFGQDLRRRHEGPLVAIFHDLGQGHGGDDGLAGADVALDEAVHRSLAFHVVLDVQEGPRLVTGEFKGQLADEGLEQPAVGAAFDADLLAFATPPQEKTQLHVEELFQGQVVTGCILFLQ